jgi:uncharacterized protein (DUF2126 family)
MRIMLIQQVNEKDAERFTQALATRLRVSGENALPAYEDVWYYLWKSRRLPVNVDPLESKLSDPEERLRLAKVFEQGLEKIVGYTLPLRPREGWVGVPSWESGAWFLRQEHMFLVPGDSPMGLRLPLDSLPWVAKKDIPLVAERDPFSHNTMLPRYQELAAAAQVNAFSGYQSGVASRATQLVHQFAGGDGGGPIQEGGVGNE